MVRAVTVDDYTVSYADNVNAGTARVVVTGRRNYAGTVTKTFQIGRGVFIPEDGEEPGDGTVAEGGLSKYDAVVVYDGKPHTMDTNALASVRVDGKKPTVRYALSERGPWQSVAMGFVDVCTTSIWYKLSVPNYEEYVHEARVEVVPKEITAEMIARIASVDYTGAAQEPEVVVSDGVPSILTAADYTVSYSNNVNAGTAYALVEGRRNYTGTARRAFAIKSGHVAPEGEEPGEGHVPSGGVSKYDAVVVYDGRSHSIDVEALEVVELEGVLPDISYALSQHGPWQRAPITFVNACVTSIWYRLSVPNYEEYVHEARLTILPRELTSAMVSETSHREYAFVGYAVEPGVTVTDGRPSLITASDYEVGYENNVNPGTAYVVVTGRRNYTGVVRKAFSIVSEETLLVGSVKWRNNRATGTYFAQLSVVCISGDPAKITDLKYVFADRSQDGKVYAQLYNSSARAPIPQTMRLADGTSARVVSLDASKLLDGSEKYGLTDATLAGTGSVPTAQRVIELYVRSRVNPVSGNSTTGEVDTFLGYITWMADGTRYWLPVVEQGETGGQVAPSRGEIPMDTMNLAACLKTEPTADLAASCRITAFEVGDETMHGAFEVTAHRTDWSKRITSFGANASAVLRGARELTDPFEELSIGDVNLDDQTFTIPMTDEYHFFKVVLKYNDVVE